MTTSRPNRELYSQTVFVAKGMGIALVVLGHYEIPDLQPSFWQEVRELIYLFHMPLFMLLSGYLFGKSRDRVETLAQYKTFVKRKAARLIYPYLSVTLILLALKLGAGLIFRLKWPVTPDLLGYVLLNPSGGFSYLLWFIYTLFIIFLLFPLLKMVLRHDLLILAVALILSPLPWPAVFCLDLVFTYLPYFAFGQLLAKRLDLDALGPRMVSVGLTAGLILFVPFYFVWQSSVVTALMDQALLLLLGLTGSLICVLVAFYLTKAPSLAKPVAALGLSSSVIYLTHTIPMGAVKLAFFDTLKFEASAVFPFVVGGILIFAAGLLVPWLVQRFLIKPDSLIAKYVLGEVSSSPRPETSAASAAGSIQPREQVIVDQI